MADFLNVNLLEMRILNLLVKTAGFGFTVALISAIVGFYFALHASGMKKRNIVPKVALAMTFYLVSPYVHALSWMRIIGPGGFGFVKSALVLSMYYAPLGLCLMMAGLNSIDEEYVDMARLYGKDDRALYRIVMGMMKPYAVSHMSLVFIFAVSDFSVPSLFQFTSYGLEIFTVHASGEGIGNVLVMSLPLVLLNVAAASFLYFNVKDMSFKSRGSSIAMNYPMKKGLATLWVCRISALALLILGILLFSNFFMVGSPWMLVDTFASNMEDFGYSIMTSSISSFMAVLIAFVLSSRKSGKAYFLGILPLVFSGPILGILMIALFSKTSFYGFLVSEGILLVTANALKALPLVFLIISGFSKTIDTSLLDCGRIYQKNTVERIVKIDIPCFSISIMAALYFGFANSMGEISSSILLVPPGRQLVSLKIFSYLHYGSGSRVSALVFIIVVFFTVASTLAFYIFNRKRRYLR